MTNSKGGEKEMEIGKRHAGRNFVNAFGSRDEKITIDENGMGKFYVGDKSVAVWIDEESIEMIGL
jgi:alpha-amylase